MISLMQNEIIARDWLTQAQFLDIVAIAEMTSGPISINAATFGGRKLCLLFPRLFSRAQF